MQRAPGLHIGDDAVFRTVAPFRPGNDLIGRLDGQLKEEGYFQLSHDWKLDLPLMAGTIRRFSADGISPVFAFLFDEFWAPFHALDALLGGVLGRYAMLPDFWAWNVDPQKGESGWAPHRDQGRVSLAPDGAPLSLTCWIPLTEATPLNGCMYIVPAAMDPVYGTPHEKDHHRIELSAARALPAKPGDFLVWNQAVLHWGGRTSRRAEHSRVSMAMEFQRQDIEPFNLPLLPPGKPVPFELRLQLVAKQLLQYRHMYRLDPALEKLAIELIA